MSVYISQCCHSVAYSIALLFLFRAVCVVCLMVFHTMLFLPFDAVHVVWSVANVMRSTYSVAGRVANVATEIHMNSELVCTEHCTNIDLMLFIYLHCILS